MKSIRMILTVTVALFLGMAGPGGFGAATTSTVSTSFPINISVFVPCAARGGGEVVDLSGSLHAVFSTASNTESWSNSIAFSSFLGESTTKVLSVVRSNLYGIDRVPEVSGVTGNSV